MTTRARGVLSVVIMRGGGTVVPVRGGVMVSPWRWGMMAPVGGRGMAMSSGGVVSVGRRGMVVSVWRVVSLPRLLCSPARSHSSQITPYNLPSHSPVSLPRGDLHCTFGR